MHNIAADSILRKPRWKEKKQIPPSLAHLCGAKILPSVAITRQEHLSYASDGTRSARPAFSGAHG